MIRLALLLSLGLTGQAQALSCLTPDPQTTFDRVAAAEEIYYVAYGRFGFDQSRMPGMNGTPTSVPATFEGTSLTRDGFTAPFTADVTLDIGCAGPWCGGISAGREMLVFLEKRDDGLHLSLPACADTAFDTPDPALLDRITTCFRQGFCGT